MFSVVHASGFITALTNWDNQCSESDITLTLVLIVYFGCKRRMTTFVLIQSYNFNNNILRVSFLVG